MRILLLLCVLIAGCGEDPASPHRGTGGTGPSPEAALDCEVLEVRAARRGEPTLRVVRCENPGEQDVVAEASLEGHAAYSLPDPRYVVEAGGVVEIPVELSPGAVGTYRTELVLDGPGVELARVGIETSVHGAAVERFFEWPDCPDRISELEPRRGEFFPPIEFGDVRIGGTCEIFIVLRSYSLEPIEIRDFSLDPTSSVTFTTSVAPRVLPAHDGLTRPPELRLGIRFTPEHHQEETGRVNLVSGDPTSPVRYVNVVGRGVPAN